MEEDLEPKGKRWGLLVVVNFIKADEKPIKQQNSSDLQFN